MKKQQIILVLLAVSIGLNLFLLLSSGDSKLEKKAFCAQYNEAASKQITTYYSDGDVDNIYPKEIFYSPSKNTCIALWSDVTTNEVGVFTTEVIFDAITNKNYFHYLYSYYNENPERSNNNRSNYNTLLEELRN